MPKNFFIKKTLFFLFSLGMMALPCFAHAFELRYPSIFGLTINDTTTFPEYARYFFTFGIFISATLSAMVIVFGGIYYLISFGRGKFTDEGKSWIKAGIFGLCLILGSYLIVYTINPDLAIFRLQGLKPVIIANPIPELLNPGASKVIYNEIPVGILTEHLLARYIYCYDFDLNGDPVYYPLETDKGTVAGPTFITHDRTDCILKLQEASVEKAEKIKELSDKITDLMNQCDCSASDEKGNPICQETCNKDSDNACGEPDENKECNSGACADAACKFSKETKAKNCCPTDSGVPNPKNSKKNLSVKDLIEHGPMKLDEDSEKEYKGLDEFRTDRSTSIASFVEKKVKSEIGEILIIDEKKWDELNLIEQLMYLNEKIKEIKSSIENDLNNLQKAEKQLNECYYATSYIDFWKIYEQANPNQTIIMRANGYPDADISKYCKGFSYSSSSCFNVCQNACPGKENQDLSCYKNCPICKITNFDNKEDYQECLEKQAPCMQECYNQRDCLPNDNYGNFEGCLSYCRATCSDSCEERYSEGTPKDNECKKECEGNSTCLFENETKCIFDSNRLRTCAESTTNAYYLKNCVENSYLCQYGSDQYAGYPECLNPMYSTKEYSSSYIFKNWYLQICPEAYNPFTEISELDPDDPNYEYEKAVQASCVDIYPETSKCPGASNCPECPCGIIDQEDVLEFNVVDGYCSEYSYNDDPLTFYCKQSWWVNNEENKPKPIGNERFCSMENEIPVGRTIDGAEAWAKSLLDLIKNVVKANDDTISYVKKLAEEDQESYCKCDSVCEQKEGEGGKPCSTGCKYVEETTGVGPDGDEATIPAFCTFESCKGVSCQKMINLLEGGATDNCPVEKDGVEMHYNEMNDAYRELYKFILSEKRSDIFKQLSYSRKKTDQCSSIINAAGEEAKLLSCQRAEDEIIPPIGENQVIVGDQVIQAHCYGKNLKDQGIDGLANNWFCCEKR